MYHQLHSNPTLEFVAAPALAPAEVAIDTALMEQYNKELEQVRNTHQRPLAMTHTLSLGRSRALARRRR